MNVYFFLLTRIKTNFLIFSLPLQKWDYVDCNKPIIADMYIFGSSSIIVLRYLGQVSSKLFSYPFVFKQKKVVILFNNEIVSLLTFSLFAGRLSFKRLGIII